MQTITHPTDKTPQTIADIRRDVLLARISSTQPTSVDGLLRLADLALANDVAVSR